MGNNESLLTENTLISILLSFSFPPSSTGDILLTLLVYSIIPLYKEDFKCQPSLTS